MRCPPEVALSLLRESDVSQAYLKWLHNPAVIRYLEFRWHTFSFEDVISYVREMNKSPRDFLFGIFAENHDHVGNIKIGNIDWKHGYGEMGLIIGEPSAWGKGIGSRAIGLACHYAFNDLKLRKIIAGMYEPNVASQKAFEKMGFVLAGRWTKHRLCEGKYVDMLMMERLADREQ